MTVQRKWMYLEGIFIGGDIRSQLPDGAKRFDQIDTLFKKVSMSLSVNNYSLSHIHVYDGDECNG
mgnify:CR=1 FL=1